jgi:cell division protease FtsH
LNQNNGRFSPINVVAAVVIVTVTAFCVHKAAIFKNNGAPATTSKQASSFSLSRMPQNEIKSFTDLIATIQTNPGKIKSLRLETQNGQLLAVTIEEANGAFGRLDIPQGPINARLQEVVLHSSGFKWDTEAVESSPSWMAGKVAPTAFILFLLVAVVAYSRIRGVSALNVLQPRGHFSPVSSTVTFADVAGNDEAKERLQRTVTFLKHPKKLKEMGGRIPKGTMLFGPAGTGKTLLAKAVAGEAGLPFYAVSGSDFVEKFVGVGAGRVRDLFSTVRKTGGIIFFDEIDAVAKERGGPNGHDERDQTLNALLEEMDGVVPLPENVHVIAATNRLDTIDSALLRPNRFDSQIPVTPADEEGRYQILLVHTRNKKLAPGVDLRTVARRAKGFSGAKLEGACNEAVIYRLEESERQREHLRMENVSEDDIDKLVLDDLTMEDFLEGIDCIEMGPRSKRVKPAEELKQVAYHEVGHAIVGQILHAKDLGGMSVAKITIDGRANAGGYTAWDQDDLSMYTLPQLEAMGKACMGGRAAQQLCLTTVDTGASNDFERAYEIAQHIVVTYGMSTKIGPLSTGGRTSITGHSRGENFKPGPALQDEIDREVLRLVNSWMDEAKRIICQERHVVEAAVAVLLEKKTMLGEEWLDIFKMHATVSSDEMATVDDHSSQCERCNPLPVRQIVQKAAPKEAPVKLRLALINVIQAAANFLNPSSDGSTKS